MNPRTHFEFFVHKAQTQQNTTGIIYAILALAFAILWNGQMDREHREDARP